MVVHRAHKEEEEELKQNHAIGTVLSLWFSCQFFVQKPGASNALLLIFFHRHLVHSLYLLHRAFTHARTHTYTQTCAVSWCYCYTHIIFNIVAVVAASLFLSHHQSFHSACVFALVWCFFIQYFQETEMYLMALSVLVCVFRSYTSQIQFFWPCIKCILREENR